jgi:hypothetical protein
MIVTLDCVNGCEEVVRRVGMNGHRSVLLALSGTRVHSLPNGQIQVLVTTRRSLTAWRIGGKVPYAFQALIMSGFAAEEHSATWRNRWRNGLPLGFYGLGAADRRLVRLARWGTAEHSGNQR